MIRRRPGSFMLALALLGSSVLACSRPAPDAIIVFTASSLTDVAEAFADAYEQNHPGTEVIVSPGASSTLARQIRAGAPADLFLSADPRWIAFLQAPDGLSNAPTVLARNRLVVVGPPGTARWTSVEEILAVSRLGVGDPSFVPVGRYAEQALPAQWEALAEARIPMTDARAVLAAAQTGAVDAAVVYASDTLAAPDLSVLYAFEESSHAPIEIVGFVPSGASPNGLTLLAMLADDEAASVWQRFGFIPGPGR